MSVNADRNTILPSNLSLLAAKPNRRHYEYGQNQKSQEIEMLICDRRV
jgi:hypothetical protein